MAEKKCLKCGKEMRFFNESVGNGFYFCEHVCGVMARQYFGGFRWFCPEIVRQYTPEEEFLRRLKLQAFE